MDRIKDIQDRLDKTTGNEWFVKEAGSEVVKVSKLFEKGFYVSQAEDDCILDENQEEIIGSSEWLRFNQDNLSFMANAKSDIKYLLLKIKELEESYHGN